MSQTSRFYDEIARLMTNAAGMAQGVRREAETAIKSQLERLIADMDVVTREEFEAVREMAQKARTENERLTERIAELERRLAGAPAEPAPSVTVASMSAPPAEPASPHASPGSEPPTA